MSKIITDLQNRLAAIQDVNSLERLEILAGLAWETGFEDLDKAQEMNDEVIRISREQGYEYGEMLGERNLGFIAFAKSDFRQSLVHCLRAKEYFERIENKNQSANTIGITGLVYWSLGNFDFALDYLRTSEKLFREVKNYEGLPWTLTGLGGISDNLGDYDKALRYHNESMKYFRESEDSVGEARALTGIGTAYMGLKRYDEALDYHFRSLEIYQSVDNKIGVSRAYNDIGLIHQEQGNYLEAMEWHRKSLELRRELDNKHIIITSLLNIGKLYNLIKNGVEALKVLQDAREYAEELEVKPKLYQVHRALSEAFELKGELKYALLHLKLYEHVKDEVFGEESRAKLRNMEIQHEVEAAEKEAEIHRLRNIELKEALDNLQHAQVRLVQSERMAVLGQLTAGIAHEINNPIGAAKSSADISLRGIKKIKSELNGNGNDSIYKTLGIMEKNGKTTIAAVERVAKIVSNLKNFSRLDEAEYKRVNLHDGIESTLALLQYSIPESVKIAKKFGRIPELLVYPNQLNQVFMTLIKNAVQAVGKTGEVSIRTELADNKVLIEVSDNGRGIHDEVKDKIFDLSFTTKNDGRIGFGMGLYNARNIVQNHNGELLVESTIGKGTRFNVFLPVN